MLQFIELFPVCLLYQIGNAEYFVFHSKGNIHPETLSVPSLHGSGVSSYKR